MSSPTARTLAECKKRGWTVQVVEKWNAFAKVRVDLFGFIDLVAMDGKCIYGIQSTSGSNLSARLKKIGAEPRALALAAGKLGRLKSQRKCYAHLVQT
jgi:hypothetical protein